MMYAKDTWRSMVRSKYRCSFQLARDPHAIPPHIVSGQRCHHAGGSSCLKVTISDVYLVRGPHYPLRHHIVAIFDRSILFAMAFPFGMSRDRGELSERCKHGALSYS